MSVSRAHPPVLTFAFFTRDGRARKISERGANRLHMFLYSARAGSSSEALLLVRSPYAVGRMRRSVSKSWGDAIEIDAPLWRTLGKSPLLSMNDNFQPCWARPADDNVSHHVNPPL